jgi:hypothetical protein
MGRRWCPIFNLSVVSASRRLVVSRVSVLTNRRDAETQSQRREDNETRAPPVEARASLL